MGDLVRQIFTGKHGRFKLTTEMIDAADDQEYPGDAHENLIKFLQLFQRIPDEGFPIELVVLKLNAAVRGAEPVFGWVGNG